jgi:hypothetical protein
VRDSTIESVPIAGGNVSTLATGSNYGALAVNATKICWVQGGLYNHDYMTGHDTIQCRDKP